MRRGTSTARPATWIVAHTADYLRPTRHIGLTAPRNGDSPLDYEVPALDYLRGSPRLEGIRPGSVRVQTDLIAAAADFSRSPPDLPSPLLDFRRGRTDFAPPVAGKIARIGVSSLGERHSPLTSSPHASRDNTYEVLRGSRTHRSCAEMRGETGPTPCGIDGTPVARYPPRRACHPPRIQRAATTAAGRSTRRHFHPTLGHFHPTLSRFRATELLCGATPRTRAGPREP